jgi:hypothetical protein
MVDYNTRPSLNERETVLYSFDKSATEQIRLSETVFRGKPYIDFRVFTLSKDGQAIPTRKGITFSKDLAKFFKQALNTIL